MGVGVSDFFEPGQEDFDAYHKQRYAHYKEQRGVGKAGADLLARSSAARHFRESGNPNFRRNAPLQVAPAGHDSIESEAPEEQAAVPQAQPSLGAPVTDGVSDADFFSQVFGKAGGLNDGFHSGKNDGDANEGAQADSGEADGPKKLGWGSRLWNGLKGLGGILKNVTGYNLIRHALFGANFRRGKVNKNFKKATALINQMQDAAPGSDERRKLESEYTKVDHKLNTNRSKLGLHRQYYTGRMMAREFTRLGRGTDLKMRENEGFRHFMTGGIEGGRDPFVAAAAARSKARAPEPDFDVIKNQQNHDDNDDLEYDENGNVIFS